MATASRRCTMMSAYLCGGEQMDQEAVLDGHLKGICTCGATRELTPPDGRREVCVDGGSQAVVVEVAVHAGAEVDGLHHAASGQDPQQRVEVGEAVHGGDVQGVGQSFGRVRVDLHILVNGSTEVPSYCCVVFLLLNTMFV